MFVRYFLILCCACVFITTSYQAKPATKIAPLLKDSKPIKGYWKLNEKDGKYLMTLRKGDLNRDFLMTASIAQGVGEGGIFAGTLLKTRVMAFRIVEDYVQLIYRNINHISSKDKALKHAVKYAFRDTIIGNYPIAARQGGKVLFDATTLMKSDLFYLAGWLARIKKTRLSYNPKISHVKEVKNFPKNIEIRSNLAYTQRDASGLTSHFEILVHFSFFPFPKTKYRPRLADQRVGYFLTVLKDFSIQNHSDNFVRYINRWDIRKADPGAKMSLPNEPIVFYLAKTIPHKYRKHVREAILEWNKAFEKVGILGALEARVQTSQDDWDPEDNRYHVVSWITSERAQFGAIGPSRVNPLTGQILDADILFDESRVRGAIMRLKSMFENPEPSTESLRESFADILPHSHADGSPCSVYDVAGEHFGMAFLAQLQAALDTEKLNEAEETAPKSIANTAKTEQKEVKEQITKPKITAESAESQKSTSSTTAMTDPKAAAKVLAMARKKRLKTFHKVRDEYIGQLIKWIIMHEVGHTLGLRHNFKASTVIPNDKLHDKELVAEKGLYGSVMEYPGININKDFSKQGYYYTPTLGPYDYWAIEYGYKQIAPAKEKKVLAKIAKKSYLKELAYATDEDTRGFGGTEMDPYANVYDLGEDPMAFAEDTIEMISASWTKIVDRMIDEGQNYIDVENAYFGMINAYVRSLKMISKFVAGKQFLRIHKGDTDERPIIPVSFQRQRKALTLLSKYAFDDKFLQIPAELAESMPSSRWWHWGSNIYNKPVDKNIFKVIAYVQKQPIRRLLYPRVMARLIDQKLLYPDSEEVLGLEDTMDIIYSSIFKEFNESLPKNISESNPFIGTNRRNLQRYYIDQLMNLTNKSKISGYDIPYDAKTLARHTLDKLTDDINEFERRTNMDLVDSMSKVHIHDTEARVKTFLNSSYRNRNY